MSSTHRPARPDGPPAQPCGHLRRALGREHNPLGRAVDRARSRAVVLTVLGIALAALLGAGAAVPRYTAEQRAAAAAAARLQKVDAVLQGPVRTVEAAVVGGRPAYHADAAWTRSDGRHHTGSIDVPRNTGPGATVVILVDEDGRPTAAPPGTADLVADAVCVGLSLFGLLGALLFTGLLARLSVLDRRADRAWTRSWARWEPVWSGRDRHPGHDG
ncbi:hypothetical protein [Kitasatospora sp. NPDC001527]|uniref:Rv1733c family protein n=1 Tax=Kitasatospora sp. NPDC001527 TaxID=3154519 RepID=UPI0033291121